MALRGKLQRSAAFFAGAALATLGSDVALMAASGRVPPPQAWLHHIEFVCTLVVLVGLAGVIALQAEPAQGLRPRTMILLGAVAAIAGYAIGVMLAPALGQTASIVAIMLVAGAIPALASRWHRPGRA